MGPLEFVRDPDIALPIFQCPFGRAIKAKTRMMTLMTHILHEHSLIADKNTLSRLENWKLENVNGAVHQEKTAPLGASISYPLLPTYKLAAVLYRP